MFYVFRHGYIGESGDFVCVEVNAREGDGVLEDSASVAPTCGAELDFGREDLKVARR